ncbi:MAG: nucleotide sugar dehydrogenase [Dehalococcoidia bacterium]
MPPKAKEAPASSEPNAVQTQSVCVVGLGYVGLPIATVLAASGLSVFGVDVDPRVRGALVAGEPNAAEEGLAELLKRALAEGRLAAGERPKPADAFIIAVPTPLYEDDGKSADLSHVEGAARAVSAVVRPGNLVILESTVPPGTTEQLLVPQLERSGLKAGRDLLVAHVPERVLPGNLIAELTQNARVIGGIDRRSAEAARDLYARFVEGGLILTDARTAEMVKLMENTYRDVNVALANEFAVLAEDLGVDVWRALDIANQHPRVNIHRPGPGVGGHCVPVDPWFLASASSYPAPLIRAARAVNDAMPERIAAALRSELAAVERPVVALLGLAYKGNTDDTRNSPALALARQLSDWQVRAHDPRVRAVAEVETFDSAEEAARGADALVLMTDHREFADLDPNALRTAMRGRFVYDTRGLLDAAAWRAAGFDIRRLGAPAAPPTRD